MLMVRSLKRLQKIYIIKFERGIIVVICLFTVGGNVVLFKECSWSMLTYIIMLLSKWDIGAVTAVARQLECRTGEREGRGSSPAAAGC